jgi:hypothetical protein
MQLDKETVSTNVVSIFKKADSNSVQTEQSKEEDTFASVMQKNRDAEDRLRKERAKANKAVLRSYRIKT